MLEDGLTALANMWDQEIVYPIETMKRVAKHLKLRSRPQKMLSINTRHATMAVTQRQRNSITL